MSNRLRRFGHQAFRWLYRHRADLLILAGALVIAYAGWLIYQPAGYAIIGVTLGAFGVVEDLTNGHRR